MRAILSIMFFQLLFMSCQKTATPLPEEVLENAVKAHGGVSVFKAVQVFSFDKKTSSYDSQYQYDPHPFRFLQPTS